MYGCMYAVYSFSDEGRDRGAGEDHIGLGGRRQGQGGAAQVGRDQAGKQGRVIEFTQPIHILF